MKKSTTNYLFAAIVVVLSFAPIFIFQGKEFKAVDSKNQTAVEDIKPDYKPWITPIVQPSGGEIETFLFTAQGAIGAGITGYILGFYRGRSKQKNNS
jgi:cobalt/nickel transport protein